MDICQLFDIYRLTIHKKMCYNIIRKYEGHIKNHKNVSRNKVKEVPLAMGVFVAQYLMSLDISHNNF